MGNLVVVSDARIREGLEVVLENYQDMNTVRSKEKNRIILNALRGTCEGIQDVLMENYPGFEIWVNNACPIGNWPAIPWMAFGGPSEFRTKRIKFSININYHFVADMSGVLLVILPFAKGWKERFGDEWLSKFEPFKTQFRKDLAWMKDYGFKLDDHADIKTRAQSGSDMRDGYIVYKHYPLAKIPSEAELQSDLVIACKAQQQLVDNSR